MKATRTSDNKLSFMCPGCNQRHTIGLIGNNGPQWVWNGDKDKPTLSPSVLVRTGHYVDGDTENCWCAYNREHPDDVDFECVTCHSFVKDGMIQFLNDCTHSLSGKTVELPDIIGEKP